jgi:hypothetical protein
VVWVLLRLVCGWVYITAQFWLARVLPLMSMYGSWMRHMSYSLRFRLCRRSSWLSRDLFVFCCRISNGRCGLLFSWLTGPRTTKIPVSHGPADWAQAEIYPWDTGQLITVRRTDLFRGRWFPIPMLMVPDPDDPDDSWSQSRSRWFLMPMLSKTKYNS